MADENGSSGGTWSFMQTVLGFVVVAGFFGIIFSWMYYPPKSTDPGILAILNQLTGIASTLTGLVVGFYFGSSKGSQDKDATATLSAQTASTAVTAAASTAATTAAALDKVMSGTGNGGDPHATTVKVTPPPSPDSVKVETKITDTSKGDK